VRRRLRRAIETLGVREADCGAEDCLTGEELKRRFEEPEVMGSTKDAEIVRWRKWTGRGWNSLSGEMG
jgi:hypothetical protein